MARSTERVDEAELVGTQLGRVMAGDLSSCPSATRSVDAANFASGQLSFATLRFAAVDHPKALSHGCRQVRRFRV